MSGTITLHEALPHANWPSGRMPEWVDEGSRLYTGVTINAAARDWHEILVVFDGKTTMAYLTANGFDMRAHGPAITAINGGHACYRKVLREWFRDFYKMGVTFE